MQPTHVNAYKAELAEAEQAVASAKGRVASLKATIASMEEETTPTEPVQEAAPVEEVKAEPKPKSTPVKSK